MVLLWIRSYYDEVRENCIVCVGYKRHFNWLTEEIEGYFIFIFVCLFIGNLDNDPVKDWNSCRSNKMEERTLSDFIRNLNSNLRKSFRHYERLSHKIINTTYAIKFNNICLQEHLCPKTIFLLRKLIVTRQN